MANESQNYSDRLCRTLEYERFFRAHLIGEAATAEASLEELIAWLFCQNGSKHDLFFGLVFREGRIGFKTKLNIARRLLEALHPDLAKRVTFWLRGLDGLLEIRNKVAHGRLDVPANAPRPEESDGVGVRVLNTRGRNTEFLTRAEVERHLYNAHHLITVGALLGIVVEGRETGHVNPTGEAALLHVIAEAEKSVAPEPRRPAGPKRGRRRPGSPGSVRR